MGDKDSHLIGHPTGRENSAVGQGRQQTPSSPGHFPTPSIPNSPTGSILCLLRETHNPRLVSVATPISPVGPLESPQGSTDLGMGLPSHQTELPGLTASHPRPCLPGP